MITLRRSRDRGGGDRGWLTTHHTFSFGDYYDPEQMGFGALRVLNEDYVQPGRGFETHSHENMEIVSYIFQGAIEHRDSGGNRLMLKAGEVQRMTAGTGITHSEHNPSADAVLGFFQIWIEPDRKGLAPDYESIRVAEEEKRGKLKLLVSPAGEEGSLRIHQDACIYASVLAPGGSVNHAPGTGRRVWIQLLRGNLSVQGERLEAGDGAALSGTAEIMITASEESEFLLIDLA